jgi:hypothetical protein
MNRGQRACLFIVFLALFENGASAETNQTHAAAVLFENFETVFHTTPALISDSRGDVAAPFTEQPFSYLRIGLEAIDKHLPAKVLAESEAVLIGTKDYHAPIGLGSVRSTRCYIIVLQRDSAFELSRYFRKVEVASAEGAPVWNWSADLEEFGESDPRPSGLFAAQIAQSYILVSNDLDELLYDSVRLMSVDNDARVFSGIREWNDVSQHEFWGYRRYKHDRPRTGMDRLFGTDQITSQAEAAILYVDLKKGSGVIHLLSSSADDATASKINATGRITPLKPAGEKVWETVFPLAEVGPFPESAVWVMWLFGWGVVV